MELKLDTWNYALIDIAKNRIWIRLLTKNRSRSDQGTDREEQNTDPNQQNFTPTVFSECIITKRVERDINLDYN